jgi:RimJ/RimL family protein N-acetyltransferase
VPDEWEINDAYIASEAGDKILDYKENNIARINYSIDPSFRCKGYGHRMITLGEQIIKNEYSEIKLIQAEVKSKNKASQNIFRKLNYIEYQEKEIIKFIKSIPPNRSSKN